MTSSPAAEAGPDEAAAGIGYDQAVREFPDCLRDYRSFSGATVKGCGTDLRMLRGFLEKRQLLIRGKGGKERVVPRTKQAPVAKLRKLLGPLLQVPNAEE